MKEKVRHHLLELRPYEALHPVEGAIKLDGNENPYGCSPKVKEALANYPFYHLYPDPEQRELRKALADYAGAKEENIVVGNGSDEIIDLILRLFLEPGEKVIDLVPTFIMFSFRVKICKGEVVEVEREEDFSVDIDKVFKAIDNQTKLIFIASPNNPTGNVMPLEDIEEIAKRDLIVVVDEAYYEFCGMTALPLMNKYKNLLIIRSFSKWAGLAGLRLGYGIFPPEIAELLLKIKSPYNVNRAAQAAAIESLKDLPYLQGNIKKVIAERERLFLLLQELEFLKPFPSQANFILCFVQKGQAKEVHKYLQSKGIFIRYFNTPRLKDYLRISVGKPEDTDALIKALKEWGRR